MSLKILQKDVKLIISFHGNIISILQDPAPLVNLNNANGFKSRDGSSYIINQGNEGYFNNRVSNVPVAIIASNRPAYLYRMLR